MRSVVSSRHSGAISKKNLSRSDRSAGFDGVSRELNFANADCRQSSSGSKRRRRSDRLLQKKLNASVLSSDKTGAAFVENSLKGDNREGDVAQVHLVPGDDNRIVESLFGEIFDDASLRKVDVEQCVSLPELRTRPLHHFGVLKAVHLLRGSSIGSVTGHVCVGKFPVIAELPSEYEDRVLDYFCSQGRDKEASRRYISKKKVYHVVNGGYEHEGRWRLIDEGQYQFSGIKWRTVQISWQKPKVLRAISIMSSQVQKKEFAVELSFLDEMVYLRRVIQDYVNEHAIMLDPSRSLPRGFCKEICKAYSGGADYSNNTLRHLVSIAAKITMRTMLMMRKAIDEECPSIASSIHKKAKFEDRFDLMDTRVFRTLINSKTLRGAKTFLATETDNEDRLNALHRLRYIAQENGCYKGVDPTILEAQLKAAMAGRNSIKHFKVRILKDESWPIGIRPLLHNILSTTKLDSDIKNIEGDPDKLLEPLKMKYLECAGGEGGSRVEQYEKFVQDRMRIGISTVAINGNQGEAGVRNSPFYQSISSNRNEDDLHDKDLDISASVSGSGEVNLRVESRGESTPNSLEKEVSPATHTPQDEFASTDPHIEEPNDSSPCHSPDLQPEIDILDRLNIEAHGMSFEDYNRTVLTEQEIFDLVISDPFQKSASAQTQEMTPERRISFIQFIRKVLVPGGHVFLILPQLEMPEWLEAFENLDMKNEGVFLLLKDPEHVQRVKGKRFQNLIEVAAVARKPGRHPTRFSMDIVSPYTQLPRNTYKRKAPVIDHISPPSNRLRFPGSKALVRTGEKSPALFWELLKTFCPAGGKVLDPFAATLTAGIAGIQTGRSCVLLESDSQCLSLAQVRLREIATKHLEDTEELVPSCVTGPVELWKEGGITRDGENKDVICSNDNLQGNFGAEDTMLSCADGNADLIRGDDHLSVENEDSSDARESGEIVGSADDIDESYISSGLPSAVGSEDRSEPAVRVELHHYFPHRDQGTMNTLNTPTNSTFVPETNAQHSKAIPTVAEISPAETDEFCMEKANETTLQLVKRKSKDRSDVARGCLKDLQSTKKRPQRKRKKTSRYP